MARGAAVLYRDAVDDRVGRSLDDAVALALPPDVTTEDRRLRRGDEGQEDDRARIPSGCEQYAASSPQVAHSTASP